MTHRGEEANFIPLAEVTANRQKRLNAYRLTGIQSAVRMNIRILLAVIFAGFAAGNFPLRADDAAPLPAVEGVLKRVVEQVEKEDENERTFKETYSYTRSKKTEFKNSKGEVKKTDAKTRTNDPLSPKRIASAQKRAAAPEVKDDGEVTETKSNVRGKAFEKSDFPLGDDLMSRFVFTIVRRELVNGRPVLVIDFEPAKKKLPEKSIKEKFLNKAAGRVWVDEQDSVPVKADLHLSAPVSVLGGLVGAVQKFTFSFNRQRTPEGMWFTLDSDWHLEGREVFVRRIIDYHETITDVTRVVPPATAEPAR